MSNDQIGKVVVNSTTSPVNNIVSGEKLREVQSRVLRDLKDAIINSMGPMGSNTLILRGTSDADIVGRKKRRTKILYLFTFVGERLQLHRFARIVNAEELEIIHGIAFQQVKSPLPALDRLEDEGHHRLRLPVDRHPFV